MAKRRKGRRSMGALARSSNESMGLAGFLGLGAIGEYVQDAVDLGIMAGSGIGAAYVGEQALARIPWVKDQNEYVKGGLLLGLGAVSGIGLKRMGGRMRGVGAGVGVGFGVAGGYRILSKLFAQYLPALSVPAMVSASTGTQVKGLAATFVDDVQSEALGLTQVEEVNAAAPFMLNGLGIEMDPMVAATL